MDRVEGVMYGAKSSSTGANKSYGIWGGEGILKHIVIKLHPKKDNKINIFIQMYKILFRIKDHTKI